MKSHADSEQQINSLLREATEADASAGNARLWASAEYVGEKTAAAEAAWARYRAVRDHSEGAR